MKKICNLFCAILFCAMLLFTGVLFAQDSTVVTPSVVVGGGSWISDNYLLVVGMILGVYELIARLIPTVKNISILSAIIAILNKSIPNKSVSGTTFKN